MDLVEYHNAQAKLKLANGLYHAGEPTGMSDFDYTKLFAQTLAFEVANPEHKLQDSITGQVGAPVDGETVTHDIPMLSLNNVFTLAELERFTGTLIKGGVWPTWKADGVALTLRYDHGKLVEAALRGNGHQGEPAKHYAPFIQDVPVLLTDPVLSKGVIEVRGEAIITRRAFSSYNVKQHVAGKPPSANPRNLVAGSFRLKDLSAFIERRVSFLAYDIVAETPTHPTHLAKLQHLEAQGWRTPRIEGYTPDEPLAGLIERLEHDRKRLPYDTDGIVFTANDVSEHIRLGDASGRLKYATAYKFEPEQATSIVESITVQISRTGAATPVANIAPVQVGGVTVTNASLHNPGKLESMDVRIGDTVVVQRAGEVVPEIARVVLEQRLEGSVPFEMPSDCPSCGEPLIELESSARMHCVNNDCLDRCVAKLDYAFGPDCLDIDKFGPVKLRRALEVFQQKHQHLPVNWVNFVYILRREAQHAERYFPGVSAKEYQEMQLRLNQIWDRDPDALLVAFGIQGLGSTRSKRLINSGNSPFETPTDDLLAKLGTLRTNGILDSTSERALQQWLVSECNNVKEWFFKLGLDPRRKAITSAVNLSHLTFCISGYVPSGKRKLTKALELVGANVYNNLTAETDFLISEETTTGKYKQAIARDIPVISEADALTLIQHGSLDS